MHPFNELWQAPLLRHFNLNTIKKPTGVGDMEYIIQVMEPTILWPEVHAMSTNITANFTKFIYEDIICWFVCIPFFTFNGGYSPAGDSV